MALPTLIFFTELTTLSGRQSTDKAQRIFKAVFADRVKDRADMELIKFLPDVPVKGSYYLPGDYRICRDVTVAGLDQTQHEFIIHCDFEAGVVGEQDVSPLLRKDTIRGDFTTQLRPYYEDVNGKPAMMTNGQPFEEMPRRFAGMFKLTVTGNRPLDPSRYEDWAGYIYPQSSYNLSTVTVRGRTFGAKRLLLMELQCVIESEGTETFERWTWGLAINPEGWDISEHPSRGYEELTPHGLRKIPDADKQEQVTRPYPLKEDGSKADVATAKPYMVELQPYKAKEFAVFTWSTEL